MARKPADKDALATALHILALREHTSFELCQKLRLRGYQDGEITDAVRQCQTWNYLNDARAARVLAKGLARKGSGIYKIKLELQKRKVAPDIMDAVIQELNSNIDQFASALFLINKKFVQATDYSDVQKQKGKIYRYLQNKGYGAEIIFQVFETFYQQ